jgi:glycosyltransferase involved in cell wall biosynthesis
MGAAGVTDPIFAPLAPSAPSILFAGDMQSCSTGMGLVQGFRSFGWDVAEVSLRDASIITEDRTLRGVGRLIAPFVVRAYNRAILKQAALLRPDIMLTVKGLYIDPETLRALRRQNIRTVNFYPDYKFEYPGFDEQWLSGYDLVATTKSFQVDYLAQRLGAERVALVHHGYVPDVHRRRTTPGREPVYLWDLGYVGNASPNKFDWLSRIVAALPDLSMIVVGHGWSEMAAGTPVERFVLGHALTGDHFARVIEHSRINLAVHHGNVSSAHGWEDKVSTRTFEIPASGGFMLHVDNDDLRSLYEPEVETGVFEGADDLIAKIRYYLDNPEERHAIAERGHARAVPAYSLTSRAAELAELFRSRFPRA